MKILFVVPPYRTTDRLTSALYPMPYAAVSLAAVLEGAGHEVEIKDFLVPRQESSAEAPESFRGFRHPPYRHHGVPLDEACEWLRGQVSSFDAVGLCSCQCNIWETTSRIGQTIAETGTPLVVGGPFASTAPELVLRGTGAAVLVRGEAEEVVVDAFERATRRPRKKKVEPEVVSGTIVKLGKLPLPAWHLAPPTDYPEVNGRVRGVLAASRGCPWECEFCSVRSIMSKRHRRLPRARLIAELRQLYGLGVRYFSFLDDNLFVSPKAAEDLIGIVKGLRAAEPGWSSCRFYVEEGIEVRVAKEPGLLRRAADAGFENLAIGLETLNARAREEAKKPYSEDDLRAALAEFESAGIAPRAFYIIGFPGETVDSVARNLVEFGSLGLAARPNNLKVYPGTELASRYAAAGWIDIESYDWRRSSWHTPESDGLRFAEIVKLKTVLGAIGFAAEAFGVRLLRDSIPDIATALEAKKYRLVELKGGGIRISGNLYRATPYRHMAALLVLRGGHLGTTVKVEKSRVTATPAAAPADEIQAAIGRAIRGEQPETVEDDLHRAREPEPGGPGGLELSTGPIMPTWVVGDSRDLDALVPSGLYDLVFTCPPYYDLERYTDEPGDLSVAATYEEFLEAYGVIIEQAAQRLRENRFAVLVVGEIRDGQTGANRGLVPDTIRLAEKAGLKFYNDVVLVTPHGSLPVRAARAFEASRKLGKTHQNVLVFVKGDWRKAVAALGSVEFGKGEEITPDELEPPVV